MLTSGRIARAYILGALIVLIGVPVASAEDADTLEIQRYTLTAAALARYSQATTQLAASGSHADACGDEASESQSIDDMVASLDAVPAARDAVQSAGMTLREYVVFSLSLLHNGLAAWAASQPGGELPPGVSQANVDFVNAHDAELKQLAQGAPEGDCGEEAEEDAVAE